MIIGAYYLTELVEGDLGEGRVFGSVAEALQAYEAGDISLHAKISLRDDQAGERRGAADARAPSAGSSSTSACRPASGTSPRR